LGLHLRSFVTTTKPQPSLNHNLKSVPLVLTGDKGRMIGTIAPFVFVLTNFARSDGRIRSGAGAVMVATSGAFPTASGLVAIRRSESPQPRTLSVREAQETIAEWKLVRSTLDRGFVKWR